MPQPSYMNVSLDSRDQMHLLNVVRTFCVISLGDVYAGVAILQPRNFTWTEMQKFPWGYESCADTTYIAGFLWYRSYGFSINRLRDAYGVPGEKMLNSRNTLEMVYRDQTDGKVISRVHFGHRDPYGWHYQGGTTYRFERTDKDRESINKALEYIKLTVEDFPHRMNTTAALTWDLLDRWGAEKLGLRKEDWKPDPPKPVRQPRQSNRPSAVGYTVTETSTGERVYVMKTLACVRIGDKLYRTSRDLGSVGNRQVTRYLDGRPAETVSPAQLRAL